MSAISTTLAGGHLLAAVFVPFAVAALTLWFVLRLRADSPVPSTESPVDQAVEIVRQRFARGEIGAREYNRLVTELTRTT